MSRPLGRRSIRPRLAELLQEIVQLRVQHSEALVIQADLDLGRVIRSIHGQPRERVVNAGDRVDECFHDRDEKRRARLKIVYALRETGTIVHLREVYDRAWQRAILEGRALAWDRPNEQRFAKPS